MLYTRGVYTVTRFWLKEATIYCYSSSIDPLT